MSRTMTRIRARGGWAVAPHAVLGWVLGLGLLAVAGCGGGGGGDGGTDPPDGTLTLEHYNAGFFSIEKPQGWRVTIAGSCGTLAFLITDPQEPLRSIFYFGTVGPVYLTQAQKDIDAWYVAHGGFPINWLDAPVIVPLTAANLLAHWPAIADMAAATAFMSAFPHLPDLALVATAPRAAMLSGGDTAEARGLFGQDGRVAEGMFLATVKVFMPVNGSPGAGTGYAHFVCGVTAPHAEFAAVSAKLVESLDSFTITQGYVDNCLALSQQQWGAVAEAGRTLSEASDILWDGWTARTHTEDIMAEQWTDAYRDVERVYDPATGQVYEVPAGWYSTYDANRAAWDMNGLQQLPDDDWALWMAAVLGASNIH
jgi:hypothetical protein